MRPIKHKRKNMSWMFPLGKYIFYRETTKQVLETSSKYIQKLTNKELINYIVNPPRVSQVSTWNSPNKTSE
jgi:hypothetical protein